MSNFTLDETTLAIFKNFANINPQAVFKTGQEQRACNPSRNFVADVELSQALPVNCAIYELNRVLGVIDTCKDTSLPVLEFGEGSLTVKHTHGEVTIPYAHSDVVAAPPSNKFHMVKPIASFDLPLSLWGKIKRLASTLEITSLHIIVDKKGSLHLKLVNDKDKGGDSTGSAMFEMPNTEVQSKEPNVWAVKFESLELLPGDYKVEIGEVGTSTGSGTLFGVFFRLNDPTKKVTYLTSGHVVKSR